MKRGEFHKKYKAHSLGSQDAICARVWVATGFATAIVAVATWASDGALVDWAAFIGASENTWSKYDIVLAAAYKGVKLPKEDAHYFFPDLPDRQYRV